MRKLAAQVGHVFARIDNRLANFRAKLDDRLVHLRFDLLFERDLAALENFLDMRAQFARLRIDNRELLFNAESVGVVLFAHAGFQTSLKKNWLSSRVAQTRGDLT